MSKTMLIGVDWEVRVAFLKDNTLESIYVDQYGKKEEYKGNIYKGIVEQVQPSINAAFVNIGLEKNAFLALDAVDYAAYIPKRTDKGGVTIQSVLSEKQEVIVQVVKDATLTKGACLTTFISIPGRYLVFSSSPTMMGISKRISNYREKTRLNKFVGDIVKTDNDNSVIIRTAAIGIASEELKQEYHNLKNQWLEILAKNNLYSDPVLLTKEQPFIAKVMRDYYTKDVDEIYVDDTNTFQAVQSYLEQNCASDLGKLQFYADKTSLFSHFNVEQGIQQLSERKVILPSGAHLVIDQAEALVAIDVNSASAKSNDTSETMFFQINIEAAQEAARQIRLRNLFGLIVIDFIDMQSAEQRRKIEETFKQHMSQDKAQHTIYSISRLGLLELSRQRLGQNLAGSALISCPSCKGVGKIVSFDTQINKILRQIKNKAQRGDFIKFTVYISSHLYEVIRAEKLNLFRSLEEEYAIKINIEEEKQLEFSDEAEIVTIRNHTQDSILEQNSSKPELKKPAELSTSFVFQDINTTEAEKNVVLNEFQKIQDSQKDTNSKNDTWNNQFLWKTPAMLEPKVSLAKNLPLKKDYLRQTKPHSQKNIPATNFRGNNFRSNNFRGNDKAKIRGDSRNQTISPRAFVPKPRAQQQEKVSIGGSIVGLLRSIFLKKNKEQEKITKPTTHSQTYQVRKKSATYRSSSSNFSHARRRISNRKPLYKDRPQRSKTNNSSY